jgi:hypothetical protein
MLYQKYAGHDNNRDWYMFTQVETELTVRHVYDRFRPQIVHDVHQMARRGARLFVPPYLDPWEPNVDPALRAAVSALGSAVAARLVAEGRTGVVTQALFDAWSPARAYPHTHGGVRILSETASADLASPLELRRDGLQPGLGYDPRTAAWNFPAPWPGGTWRLADVVDYQLAASWAVLDHAARNREHWLRTFLGVNRRACDLRSPFAFVFPAEQEDPLGDEQRLDLAKEAVVLSIRQLTDSRRDSPCRLRGREPIGPRGVIARVDAALQRRHPHHEKLVEVRAEDGEKLHSLEQGHAWILRLLEHAPIELEPRDLAVDERVRVHSASPRKVSCRRMASRIPRVHTASDR